MINEYGTNRKLNNKLIILLPFGLLLINIKFFDIFGASIKPIHFIVLLIIIYSLTKKFKTKNFLLAIVYLLIPFLALGNVISLSSFLSTYLIYFMAVLLTFFGINLYTNSSYENLRRMFILLFRFFNFTAIYGICQYVLANYFQNYSLYNNLGSLQFHPHYPNELFGISRATSIYIEPSVYAWISTTVFVIFYYLGKKILEKREYYLTGLMCLISVFITHSSAGYLGFISIIFAILLVKRRTKIVVFSQIFTLFFMILLVLSNTGIFKYLRLGEIFREDTSGYARITEPFYAMIESLEFYLLSGRGLGQIGVYDSNLIYNIYIHNSLLGIFITFGLLAFVYLIPIIKNFYRYIKFDQETLPLFINLVFIFITTGSFLSLELPVIFFLMVLAISCKNNSESS